MTKDEIKALAMKAYMAAKKKPAFSLPVIVKPDDGKKCGEKKASANEAYERGFRKCAEAHGVDPQALARFIISKEAADTDIWGKVKTWLDQAKSWYGKQDAGTKALINAGGGALVGTGLGAAVTGGKKGLVPGAIIGGIGGAAAPHVNWKAVIDSLESKLKK